MNSCTPFDVLKASPSLQRKSAGFRRGGGFTLAELLVTAGVLVLLVVLAAQLVNGAASVAILGHKRMDVDAEARQVFDRMAIDFAQMVKRVDVDYYLKLANQQQRQNDQIAFYSAVPGYYPPAGAQSPVSLVAYRVNSDPASASFNKLERLGKGLLWNGVSATDTPVVFLPFLISNTWPYATNSQLPDPNVPSSYEIIGPDVFRFEYYYVLSNGATSDSPNGWPNVAAIAVDLAVIDPRSRALLTEQQIGTLNGNSGLTNFLLDWEPDAHRPGDVLRQWQARIASIFRTQSLPRQAVAGIRLYERYFYVNQ